MFTFSVPTIVLSNEASYVSGAVYNIARGKSTQLKTD